MVGIVAEEEHIAALVVVASTILELDPATVREHPARWGAFFRHEELDRMLLHADWSLLTLPSEKEPSMFWVRTDLDLAHSFVQDGGALRITWGDTKLRETYEAQWGLTGTQIQSFYAQGRPIVEEFGQVTVDARLASRGESLLDALEAIFGLFESTAPLWVSRKSNVVCPRYEAMLASIECSALRGHVSGFFQARASAPDGAVFQDEALVAARRERLRMLSRQAGFPSPAFSTLAPGEPQRASWHQCPCDGSGPYGTYELRELRD